MDKIKEENQQPILEAGLNWSCELCKILKTEQNNHLCYYCSVLIEIAETKQRSAIKFYEQNKRKCFSNQVPLNYLDTKIIVCDVCIRIIEKKHWKTKKSTVYFTFDG